MPRARSFEMQETKAEMESLPPPHPDHENVIYHFSHVHPLTIQTQLDSPINARCCEPMSSNPPVYGCKPCNFFIHKACSELRPLLRHPSHSSHTLTLVSVSPYLKGSCTCAACSKAINGFFYHCTHCSYDLHAHCALLPPTAIHSSHLHILSLCLPHQYESGAWICDACGKLIASNSWIYCCNACNYGGHVDCIMAR